MSPSFMPYQVRTLFYSLWYRHFSSLEFQDRELISRPVWCQHRNGVWYFFNKTTVPSLHTVQRLLDNLTAYETANDREVTRLGVSLSIIIGLLERGDITPQQFNGPRVRQEGGTLVFPRLWTVVSQFPAHDGVVSHDVDLVYDPSLAGSEVRYGPRIVDTNQKTVGA